MKPIREGMTKTRAAWSQARRLLDPKHNLAWNRKKSILYLNL